MSGGYAFGIEEEYFLAEAATGLSAAASACDRFHAEVAGAFDAAEHELLKGEVEFASKPATDPAAALASLQEARRTLAKIAKAHGLSLFAAGSHPLGSFERQETTEKERYRKLEDQFGIITHRSMCCAMHVHVEVPDALDRVRLIEMIQIAESVTSIDLTDLRCPYLARRVRKALLRASVGRHLARPSERLGHIVKDARKSDLPPQSRR